MKESQVKMTTNRSELMEQIDNAVDSQQTSKFKFSTFWDRLTKSKLLAEAARFLIYCLLAFLVLMLLSKTQNSTIYSITSSSESSDRISLRKDVPGIFPALSKNWKQILATWDVNMMSGRNGSTNMKPENYQLQFKHSDNKQDVVYITKQKCEGHIVLNWKMYGNNIYFTDYVPNKGSMMIPNLPKDQECIREKNDLLLLLKHSTIWTIHQENSKQSLFLLVEDFSTDETSNYVLISNKQQII